MEAIQQSGFYQLLGIEILEVGRGYSKLRVNYFRPFKEGEMIAEGRIIQKGSTIAVGEMDVHDGEGTVYGKGIATYRI